MRSCVFDERPKKDICTLASSYSRWHSMISDDFIWMPRRQRSIWSPLRRRHLTFLRLFLLTTTNKVVRAECNGNERQHHSGSLFRISELPHQRRRSAYWGVTLVHGNCPSSRFCSEWWQFGAPVEIRTPVSKIHGTKFLEVDFLFNINLQSPFFG